MFSFLSFFQKKQNIEDRKILPAGDRALVVEFGDRIDEQLNGKVQALNEALKSRSIPGVVETVPTFRSLLVVYDPAVIRYGELAKKLRMLPVERNAVSGEKQRVVEIPVCYGGEYGEDLKDVAAINGLTEEEVIAIHSGREYPIYMLGFLPGFPYLGDMDPRIHTPRLSSPRTKIPAGSVGIGGEQTGIYPMESPGGWRLIGRTPLKLYDPNREDSIPYRAGDRIRFVPISREQYRAYETASSEKESETGTARGMRILQPGALTTVQDLGRNGYMDRGFQVSGAADPYAMKLANLLVGNRQEEAVLEMTMLGASIQFDVDTQIVLTGADLQAKLNRKPVARFEVLDVHGGDLLEMGFAVSGCRGYLAVRGGMDLKPVLGSCSTNLKCGIGGFEGRALKAGDVIPLKVSKALGTEEQKTSGFQGRDLMSPPHAQRNRDGIPVLRVVLGPQQDRFTEKGKETFVSSVYRLTSDSNRMACRMEGEAVEFTEGGDIISDGIVTGSVQIASNGMPMVMLADHQTTGGYAKIGTVINADIPVLAQCRPGDKVRFSYVSVEEAQKLYMRQEEELRKLKRRS